MQSFKVEWQINLIIKLILINTQAFDHNEVRNDNMLKTWIGDGTVYPPYQPAPAAAGQPPVAIRLTKSDPRCRFMYGALCSTDKLRKRYSLMPLVSCRRGEANH